MAMKVKAVEKLLRTLGQYLFHSDLNPKVYIAIFCISCQTGQNGCQYLRAQGQALDCVSPR